MNRGFVFALLSGLVLLLALGLGLGNVPAQAHPVGLPAAAPNVCETFSAVSTFNYPSTTDHLNAVAAVAPNNVWAVGAYNDGVTDRALIEHWNGTFWGVSLDAEPGTDHSFYGLTALDASNIWAVGTSNVGGIDYHTLVEHWDGTAWSIVPSPSPNADFSQLNSVAGASANDIWAVGYSSLFNNSAHDLLIEHWNGTAWSIFPIGTIGTGNTYLANVAVVSANDVWAAGYYQNGAPHVALAMHWNGTVWQVVPTANPGTTGNEFTGVTVVATNNVWAVGQYTSSSPYHTLTERWNGSTWNVVPSPNVGAADNLLESVSARAAADIWLAGEASTGTGYQTVAEHWDGSTWTVVPSDSPSTGLNDLHAVALAGPGDVWAVGDQYTGSTVLTLAEHYLTCPPTATPTPTSTPTPVPTCPVPQSYTYNTTTSTMAGGLTDIGNHGDDVLTTIALPFSYLFYNQPFDHVNVSSNGNLQFVSNDSAYANTCLPVSNFNYAVLPYWDDLDTTNYPACPSGQCGVFTRAFGSAPSRIFVIEWRAVEHGNTNNYVNFEVLFYESAQRVDFVYAAVPGNGGSATVGLQQDTGSNYTAYSCNAPALTPGLDIIWALAACAPPTAVPSATPTATRPPAPPSATVTSPPRPTQTPGGPSATPVPSATAPGLPSATRTPSPCALQFSDVDTSNPFYVYVHYLACQGIIAGYADGTFRPYNQITRGQISKLMTLAAGLGDPIPPGQQTFADVPGSNPFWIYVEQLAQHGYINGYGCGGAGEPCDSQQRPYFRPYTNITRGQIAKVDTNAAQYTDVIPPAQQTFADVAPGSPFWLFVERASLHGVISGYACGGGGEPCGPPANRPYFRPAGSATRGQSAKIVANTFCPGCQAPRR